MFLLYETASGYALFEASEIESISKNSIHVQEDILDLGKFGKSVHLKSFIPFKSAAHALDNLNSVSEGLLHPFLKDFLELNLPKTSKKTAIQLGVSDKSLGSTIKLELGLDCVSDDLVVELVRGIRHHGDKLLRQLSAGDMIRAQLGLSHSYSRGKVRYNVNRSDNMIIQSIALCDQLDKDINLFSMRTREWYSWHFPELAKLVSDHSLYSRLCVFIRNKNYLTEDKLDALSEVTQDTELAQSIISAAKTSMGTDISQVDMMNIDHFASRLVNLVNYRKELGQYLSDKMAAVAPNLATLIGDTVGARLISHAGSLTNLAKCPASTIQILGAEKALFRALKTKGKTPKYGLIFNSSFIGKASSKNKGRISRYLANKCSIASRIDSFSEVPSTAFGAALRKQVEDRLEFFDTGALPQPNAKVMSAVLQSLAESRPAPHESQKAKSKKRDHVDVEEVPEKEKEKKSKKQKKSDDSSVTVAEATPKKGKSREDPKKEKSSKASEHGMDLEAPKTKKSKKTEETPVKEKSAKKVERKAAEATTPSKPVAENTPKKDKKKENKDNDKKSKPSSKSDKKHQ